MAAEHVTSWLEEHDPEARVTYQGLDEEGIHVWNMEFPRSEHGFRIGIPDTVIQEEGLLAERLMELETQGWLDRAGEQDLWVLLTAGEIAEEPSLFE